MVTRLSASDASFYHLENSSTPMYVGTLSILRKPRSGLSYETLLETVERRLPQIPRYRQKVREVSMGLARPVWVDDTEFDITYHIRRSALPSPGSDAQLHDLVARLGSRQLDKSRPLWEMYLVEGLAKNRMAIYTKIAPSPRQRHDGVGDRARHRRPDPEGAGVRRGHLDTRRASRAMRGWWSAHWGNGWPARPRSSRRSRSAVTEVATNSEQLLEVGRRSPTSPARSHAAPHRAARSTPRYRATGGSPSRGTGWRTTAPCAHATTATSTTSCSPSWRVLCATGCCHAANPSPSTSTVRAMAPIRCTPTAKST